MYIFHSDSNEAAHTRGSQEVSRGQTEQISIRALSYLLAPYQNYIPRAAKTCTCNLSNTSLIPSQHTEDSGMLHVLLLDGLIRLTCYILNMF